MFEHPEFALGMLHDGDGLALGGRDLVGKALEVDGLVMVDAPGSAQGKVQIQQRRRRTGSDGTLAGLERGRPYLIGNLAGGAVGLGVLAEDLHLKNRLGRLPSADLRVGQEGDQALLKSAEAPLDLAFGLRRGSHEMGHSKGLERALELTLGIPMVAAGTGTKEAQRIGIDGFGQTVGLESRAEVAEVVPSRVGVNETTGDIEPGMIVDGEQQDLFGSRRPPLMDGTVVLPEFPDSGAAKPSITSRLAGRLCHQMGQVSLAVGRHRGPGALEGVEALEFIADELEVGRIEQRQEVFEKGMDVRGPAAAMVTTAGSGGIGIGLLQPSGAELIETGSPHPKLRTGSIGVQQTRVEIFEGPADKLGWEAMAKLFLFKH
jgi:hypothetical protein